MPYSTSNKPHPQRVGDSTRRWTIATVATGLLGVFLLVLTAFSGGGWLALFGAALMAVSGTLAWKTVGRYRRVAEVAVTRVAEAEAVAESEANAAPLEPPSDPAELVEQMLEQERYALLLRSEVLANLSAVQVQQAWAKLQDGMTLVPQGQITIGASFDSADSDDDRLATKGRGPVVVNVDQFFLDRYAVTNRQFRQFVLAGGYTQMGLWEPQIWPGVLDFVDSTGHPGPRYWKNGSYPRGEDNLPVVGVSWYEAAAYARWAGKRLSTDPEWEKAGSWPVELAASNRPQRQYPWGNAMDRERCNLWGSGAGRRVAVDRYPNGASVGGALQLVGNVWEWTSGHFSAGAYARRDLVLPTPMRSIRGGAFDTYFESQATCQFQSGEDPVARKHNIGFRCAVSVCDLALPGASAVRNEETSNSLPERSRENDRRDVAEPTTHEVCA
ncbi:MAG: SUMF1/EgtB/PvdO family nonheme iron enzyme [Pirellulales bacterium]|nr:SUMF1/EgtB/PvdO family nonheme iron enzyme [Planctomycetales bacterium]